MKRANTGRELNEGIMIWMMQSDSRGASSGIHHEAWLAIVRSKRYGVDSGNLVEQRLWRLVIVETESERVTNRLDMSRRQ